MVTLSDPDDAVWRRFGVDGQPTWAYVEGDTGAVSLRFGALGLAGIQAVFEADGFS